MNNILQLVKVSLRESLDFRSMKKEKGKTITFGLFIILMGALFLFLSVVYNLLFAFMYKDAELLRHDMLPSEVVQQGVVHYIIDENKNSDLEDVDDIIYRRMVGRGIKQLAISLLHDPTGMPSGFVGCVRYDYEKIDLTELRECGMELEQIYAANDKMVMENLKKDNN